MRKSPLSSSQQQTASQLSCLEYGERCVTHQPSKDLYTYKGRQHSKRTVKIDERSTYETEPAQLSNYKLQVAKKNAVLYERLGKTSLHSCIFDSDKCLS